MDKPDNMRLAEEADIDNLFWHLMGDLRADNGLEIPEDPRKVLKQVEDACRMEGSIAGIIDGPNGTILGSIGIQAVEPWFSSVTVLSQVWLFVSPIARAGSRLADDLFHFAEWHRQDMSVRAGYDMIFENTVWSLNRLPAKIRLWGRHGEQIGATFWRRGPVDELRQGIEERADDGADGPEGSTGVSESFESGPGDGVEALPKLQRPSRRGT